MIDYKIYECSFCHKPYNSRKFLKSVNGFLYCSDCYRKRRLERRKETINNSEDKETILKLQRELKNKYQRSWYNNNKGETRKYNKRMIEEDAPKIKNTNKELKNKTSQKSYAYLTLEEKQYLFKQLIKKGFSYEECVKKMDTLNAQQIKIRKLLQQQNKTEKEIKETQKNLMEDLLHNG